MPYINLDSAATIGNGILSLLKMKKNLSNFMTKKEQFHIVNLYQLLVQQQECLKFFLRF